MRSTTDDGALDDVPALLSEIRTRLDQVAARVAAARGTELGPPVLTKGDAGKVERVGEVAHRHLAHIEERGTMTLGESKAIRRNLYGDKVQSTANLFGRSTGKALLYRNRPYGTAPREDDEVKLTSEGARIAGLWRQLHDPG